MQSSLSHDATIFASQGPPPEVKNRSIQGRDDEKTQDDKNVQGICAVHKDKIRDSGGKFTDLLAMLYSGSNTSLLSKRTAKQLGISGPQTHHTMKLAAGGKKADVKISGNIYTVRKCCINAENVSRKAIESYPHLMSTADTLQLSDVAVDLLIGTDLVDAFVETHTAGGNPRDPFVKRK